MTSTLSEHSGHNDPAWERKQADVFVQLSAVAADRLQSERASVPPLTAEEHCSQPQPGERNVNGLRPLLPALTWLL